MDQSVATEAIVTRLDRARNNQNSLKILGGMRKQLLVA